MEPKQPSLLVMQPQILHCKHQWRKATTGHPMNNKGFSVVALCILLPLILLLTAIFIWISFWLKNFWGAQKICEEAVLKAQTQMRPLISQILDLNPEILKLRKVRTALRIKMAAAVAHGNAPLVATLKVQLKLIEIRLMALFAQQNLIFEQARLIRLRTLSGFQGQTKGLGHQQSQRTFTYSRSLGLVPDQLAEFPPAYQVPSDFTEKQSLELQWTQKLYQDDLRSFMKRGCKASIETAVGNRKWRPRLLKARGSSSY